MSTLEFAQRRRARHQLKQSELIGSCSCVQGIIMMVLGAAAIIWPQISTLAVDLYVGWMFLLSGLSGLVTMFIASSVAAFLWSLLTAALSLFVGVLLLWHPVEGAVSLTLVLIAFFIVEGVFQIAAAIRHRDGVSRFVGLAADERHRRPGACRDDDLGMAVNCESGRSG